MPTRCIWIALAVGLVIADPRLARGSGDSSQTLTIPVVDASGTLRQEKKTFLYPHYYAGDVTAATFIFARPCTSVRPPPYDPSDPNSGPAPQYSTLDRVPYDPKCARVNPLAESGITLAFDVSAADEPYVTGECTLTVDLTNARPIDTKRFPQLPKANLTSIDALVRLAITTLEANARGALIDCKIAYVGRSAAGGLPPRYRPPISCDAAPGQPAVVAAPAWKPSAEEARLRRAAAANCGDASALLDLASRLARDRHATEAFALVQRAWRSAPDKTFDRFGADAAFDELRRHRDTPFVNAFLAARGTRCASRHERVKIARIERVAADCIVKLDRQLTLEPGQRVSTAASDFVDEKHRPDVARALRWVDPQTLVATAMTREARPRPLAATELCTPAFFDIHDLHAWSDSSDTCLVGLQIRVLSASEREALDFRAKNAAKLAATEQIYRRLERLRGDASVCDAEDRRIFALCHPGASDCDGFKQRASSQCRIERPEGANRELDPSRALAQTDAIAKALRECVRQWYPGSALSHSDPAGGSVGCSHARQWTPKLTATCDDPYPNLGRFPPGP